jgi:hypothetical protein
MKISKSRYVDCLQCPKKLWLRTNNPELADEMDQKPFIIGHQVGNIAMSLFPGGTLVHFNADDPDNIANMISRTKELIDAGEAIIYEAAFDLDGLLAIADILVERDDGYHIYEVKSSTKVKDINIDDASFQYHVITNNGLRVAKANIVIINNEYIRVGDLEIQRLFSINDVTDKVILKQFEVVNNIEKAFEILSLKEHPQMDIGLHCNKPYVCQFVGHCWSHIPTPSVFDIQQLRKRRKFDYYYSGVITFEDLIRNPLDLNAKQRLQISSYVDNSIHINPDMIKRFLDKLYYPLVFLDFEKYQPSIPEFDYTKPFGQVVTQFSVHIIEEEGSEIKHFEYLADENNDPRRPVAEELLKAIPKNACVLAFNKSFEKDRIEDLADLFLDLKNELESINNRLLDLMDPFKDMDYYQKEMNGSYSIKAVLPALFPDDPELSYENLGTIKNGSEAMNAFPKLRSMTVEERERTRKDLLEYCKLDTLAMVKIWERLKQVTEDI